MSDQIFIVIVAVFQIQCVLNNKSVPLNDYLELKSRFLFANNITADDHFETYYAGIGAHIVLTDPNEMTMNAQLMSYKDKEIDSGLSDPNRFYASQSFFKSKIHIDESKVFELIRKLPKGASLHSHSTALVSINYIFNNLTYRDNLFVKQNSNDKTFILKFFKNAPGWPWRAIQEMRLKHPEFNSQLKRQMTLALSTSRDNKNAIWTRFEAIFTFLRPLLTFYPVFKDYFFQVLEEHYNDNIRYMEIRSGLPELYDLDGRFYDHEATLDVMYGVVNDFMTTHSNFVGVKIIFSPNRRTNLTILATYIGFLKKMNRKYPDFLAGFDLVGQEDAGPPLKSMLPILLEIRKNFKLFLHAGETLWNGVETDENLIDAIFLNSSRIGHGYALVKHPRLLKMVKDKDIALEICPISNQILGLVNDFRNHPLNFLIANNYSVVLCSDDPSFWGATGVSYDWYVTFMAMTSRHADLRLLKQLAINSIKYSALTQSEKIKFMKQWFIDWNQFINNYFP
ncbi:hypothetical protein ABEB36_001820 [Hypothenemus hampei]|uniref:Adenosine deaminase n=1 Tax=Hypothenemus hampei TaxID=57062 RepID=A0ABD1FFU2_HYPHA